MNRMYDLQAVKRLIGKKGFDPALKWLCSDEITEDIKSSLAEDCVYVNGYPCLSFLLTL